MFSQISWLNINQNFKKLRQSFVGERALITTTLIIFLSLENGCIFLLAKEKTWKRIFNTNSEVSQNGTEKQKLCHPKQQIG